MITKKGLNGHMRAKKLVQLLLIPMVCIGNMQSINEQDQQALFINRIADFWQEQDFTMAKNQILEFLQTYPESPYCHHFQAAIGDLYLNDEDYSNAISFYEKIQEKNTQEKIFPHKMQCYFALKNYKALLQEAKKALEENFLEDPSELHFFIATAFYYEISENAFKDPLQIQEAIKYFENLIGSCYEEEICHAYAHLLHLNHEDLKAANYYQLLAEKYNSTEYLFQAAVFLSTCDKENAYLAFQKIAKSSSEKDFSDLQKQAFYNQLVLAFQLEKHEEIYQEKEKINLLDAEKKDELNILLARSLSQTQKSELAVLELIKLIESKAQASTILKQALIELFDVASVSKNLSVFDTYLPLYEKHFQQDQNYLLAKIWKVKILIDLELNDIAMTTLNEFPEDCFYSDLVLLQWVHLSKQSKDHLKSIQYAKSFLEKFPSHEMASSVENCYLNALIHSFNDPTTNQEFALEQLQQILETSPDRENKNLAQFHLAKFLLERQNFAEAEKFLYNFDASEWEGEITLLKAFFAKQANLDTTQFISLAEKALCFPSVEKGPVFLALFNTYVEIQDFEKAAHFLELAYKENMSINESSLLWLAEQNILTNHIELSIEIFEKLLKANPQSVASIKLANLYYQTQNFAKVIDLLSPLHKTLDLEILYFLGSSYQNMQRPDLAIEHYQKIIDQSPFFNTKISASACLESCKIQISQLSDISMQNPQVIAILNLLKSLILQKNIFHEPIYLQAALEYVDLQSSIHHDNPEKRLQLLTKTWQDFTSSEHVLDKDYHANRKAHPELNTIYQGFIAFIEANIDLEKSKLLDDVEEKQNLIAQALEILQGLKGQSFHKELQARADKCLQH